MKKYIKDGMDIIVNNVIPFKGFLAMMLYGTIFWRKEYEYMLESVSNETYVQKVVNHESIHKEQMKDFCRWIPIGGTIFYIIYFFEWIYRLIEDYKNAYRNISFEREAHKFEADLSYINNRKRFAMWKK